MMNNTTTLKKWGNSQGIRLPKEIITALGLELDTHFHVSVDKETKQILLTPVEITLTPYQQLIKTSEQAKKERVDFKWD